MSNPNFASISVIHKARTSSKFFLLQIHDQPELDKTLNAYSFIPFLFLSEYVDVNIHGPGAAMMLPVALGVECVAVSSKHFPIFRA